MPRGDPASKLIERQKRAAERLRREVLGTDGSLRHPYFRELNRLGSYRCPVEPDALVAACSRADLVYIGDYHAVPACQRFAAAMLRQIAARVPRIALGVEFVYARQQRILDRRQAGLLDDAGFLRRIHYREEWGYPWEGFRELLDAARASGVQVHALDSPPRRGFAGAARRDEHAARRIVSLLAGDPATRLMVVFGQSHLTRTHLPAKVRTQMTRNGVERRETIVFQNPDGVYWRIVSRKERLDHPVQIDDTTYAVFHTSPLEKYEAYRQVLERWRGDVPADEEVDLTPAVHHLIGVLLGWLGIRPNRYRVRHRGGWADDLVDTFPEVYSGMEAIDLLTPIFEEHGRGPEEIEAARLVLSRRKSLYDARPNTLFLLRYLPGRAAGESAKYLRAALTRSLFVAAGDSAGDPAGRAYHAAFTEALAFVGSALVDPAADHLGAEEVADLGATAGSRPPAAGQAHPVDSEGWLAAHRRFERSRRVKLPEELLEPLRRSRRLRNVLARDLGRRLGRALFDRIRGGDLDQRRLRALFTRPLGPDNAARLVLRLLRG